MKIRVTFEKDLIWGFQFRMYFSKCSNQDFYNWLDENQERVSNISPFQIGYSDRTIIFDKTLDN